MGALRPGDWLIAGICILGVGVLVAIERHAPAGRSLLEGGVLAVLLSVGRTLPLVGLGVALGLSGNRNVAAAVLLFVPAAILSFLERERILFALLAGPETSYRLYLIDPLACLLAGLALVTPDQFRSWTLPPLAASIGAIAIFSIKLIDPGAGAPAFLEGAVAAALWLILLLALVARRLAGHWFDISARILGSWLIAIGLLLGGAGLAQRAVTYAPVSQPAPSLPGIPEKPVTRHQFPGVNPGAE